MTSSPNHTLTFRDVTFVESSTAPEPSSTVIPNPVLDINGATHVSPSQELHDQQHQLHPIN